MLSLWGPSFLFFHSRQYLKCRIFFCFSVTVLTHLTTSRCLLWHVYNGKGLMCNSVRYIYTFWQYAAVTLKVNIIKLLFDYYCPLGGGLCLDQGKCERDLVSLGFCFVRYNSFKKKVKPFRTSHIIKTLTKVICDVMNASWLHFYLVKLGMEQH